MEQADTADREIIYVGDPMCSWCWGVAPELDTLVERHPELPLRIVVGGLRPGPVAQTVDERFAGYLAHHWEAVERRSGQPFDASLLGRQGWLYDTEPACRAVVVMRELAPENTFPFFKRLQRAFYAEGVILSEDAPFQSLVAEFEVDADEFMRIFASEAAVKSTWKDFSLARSWGINGFPTILARSGDSASVIARGYTSAHDMEARLRIA